MDTSNSVRLTLKRMFHEIADYHGELGHPKSAHGFPPDIAGRIKQTEAMRVINALYAEIAELNESFAWKPWRPLDYQKTDTDNMKTEIVDIMFFLGSFMAIFEISPEDIEARFWQKLGENYRRIESGYNETKS